MSFSESYLGRLRAAMGQQPLISVGVRVLVEDEQGRFLVLRRADDGKWALPAGALELGESLMEAAARELREESNLELAAPTPFGLSSAPDIESHTYPNGDRVQSVALLVHMRANGGILQANDGEAHDLQFLTMAGIEQLDFVAPEWPTFAHWQRFVQTGVFQVV